MPQGHIESPAIFAQEMSWNLEGFVAPGGSILVQYVNDLLVFFKSEAICHEDTRVLLIFWQKIVITFPPVRWNYAGAPLNIWVMILLLRVNTLSKDRL